MAESNHLQCLCMPSQYKYGDVSADLEGISFAIASFCSADERMRALEGCDTGVRLAFLEQRLAICERRLASEVALQEWASSSAAQ